MSIINDALKKASTEKSYTSDFVYESPEEEVNKILELDTLTLRPLIRSRKKQWLLFGSLAGVLFLSIIVSTVIFARNVGLRQGIKKSTPFSSTIASSPIPSLGARASITAPVSVSNNKPELTAEVIEPTSQIGSIKGFIQLPNLNLNGIILGRGEPMAIINNSVVYVGDVIRGAFVVKITKDKVNLTYKKQEFALRLK